MMVRSGSSAGSPDARRSFSAARWRVPRIAMKPHPYQEHDGQYVAFRYRCVPSSACEYVSTSVEEIIGYAPDEFYSDPLLVARIVHPEDQERLELMIANATTSALLRWVHRDGGIVALHHSNLPVYDEDSRLVAMEGVARVASDPGTSFGSAGRTERNPHSTDGSVVSPLTRREMEVLWLMAEGRRNAEIATTMEISELTVARHVGKVLIKLGVRNRAGAVGVAFRSGLLPRGDSNKGGWR